MQWLIVLETNSDPITSCRLINIFRRKGVGIITLSMAARPEGFSVITVAETAEAEVDHIYNFLRRVEGVERVTYYRHEPKGDACFLFVDSELQSHTLGRVLEDFPGARMVFGSAGKFLLEVPGGHDLADVPAEVMPFARVKSSSSQANSISA